MSLICKTILTLTSSLHVTHFHVKCFARRLVLKKRQKETFIHELLTGAFDFSESQPLYPMYKNHIYLDSFDFFPFFRDGFQGDLKTGEFDS